MTLRLDPPRALGDLRIAILCDQQVTAQGWPDGAMFSARKIPVAILLTTRAGLHAIDLRGRALDPATLETHCPGLIEAMQAPDCA